MIKSIILITIWFWGTLNLYFIFVFFRNYIKGKGIVLTYRKYKQLIYYTKIINKLLFLTTFLCIDRNNKNFGFGILEFKNKIYYMYIDRRDGVPYNIFIGEKGSLRDVFNIELNEDYEPIFNINYDIISWFKLIKFCRYLDKYIVMPEMPMLKILSEEDNKKLFYNYIKPNYKHFFIEWFESSEKRYNNIKENAEREKSKVG